MFYIFKAQQIQTHNKIKYKFPQNVIIKFSREQYCESSRLKFYGTYVFLQRFFTTSFYICKFTYGMCFYNVFLHMVCIFTTFFYIPYVFLQRFLAIVYLSNGNARYMLNLHMYFYICIFTMFQSRMTR